MAWLYGRIRTCTRFAGREQQRLSSPPIKPFPPSLSRTCMGVLGTMAAVSALKALQNSIMFRPRGPKACIVVCVCECVSPFVQVEEPWPLP